MAFELRDVVGYEGLYRVTSDGRVFRAAATPRMEKAYPAGSELTQGANAKGYMRVGLRKDGKTRTRPVHQLVLEAFVGPRPPDLVGRHLDDNKSNNCADNLIWGTQAENVQDSVRNGTQVNARKTHCPANHRYDEANTRWVAVNGVPRTGRACRKCDLIRYHQKKGRAA